MAPRYPLRGDGVPRFVLTMDWQGRRLVWTSDGATVDGLDGYVVGSVELPEIEDRIDLEGRDIRERVTASIPWFEGTQPKDLQDRPCVVALVPAAGWSARYVLLSGRVTTTELDRPGALIGIEISPEDYAGRTWPPATWTVTPNTHPQVDNGIRDSVIPAWFDSPWVDQLGIFTDGPHLDEYGKGYPVIYGQSSVSDRVDSLLPYGGGALSFDLYVPTSPCPVVDDVGNNEAKAAEAVLLGAGSIPADGVYLWSLYEHNGQSFLSNVGEVDPADVVHDVDFLGQEITIVRVHNETTSQRRGQWFAATQYNASPTASAGAGHVAAWFLSQVGAIDLTWSGEACARSVDLTLGGYIDEPIEPLQWVQENVSGRFPIGTSRAPSGALRLQFVDFRGQHLVASLTDGQDGVHRAGSVSEVGERTPRQVEVRYRYNVARERHMETIARQDGPRSEAMVREVIEVDNVHTNTAAETVAAYALWRGRYRREVQLDVAVDTWGWLRPGHVVRYTDPDLGVTSRAYLVASIQRTDRPFTSVTLTPIQPDPL